MPSKVAGITFSDPLTAVQQYSFLTNNPAEPVIALTHIGNYRDNQLAATTHWLHAVIGGHSHTSVYSDTTMPVVAQAGDDLKQVGIVTIQIKDGRVDSAQSKLVDLSTTTGESAAVRTAVDNYNSNPVLQTAPGTLETALSGKDQLGSLMTDAYRYVSGADAAFQNNGGIRVNSLDAGPLTIEEIYMMDPFNNALLVHTMSLSELSNFIRFRNETLQVSGIKYDSQNRLTFYDGTPLTDRSYRIALNSYVSESFDYVPQSDLSNTGVTTEEALIIYLSNNTPLGVPEHLPRTP